ncbi:MAG: hypothetical protein KTR33_17035 [Gammaproteobacteria bacterium]|nr:hypothetical protein [Gammaproteobacteria bacterium]
MKNSIVNNAVKTAVKKSLAVATLAAPALFAANVQASGFAYDGIQLSYEKTSFAASSILQSFDFNTVRVEGMYSISPTIVVGGTFSSGSGDTRGQAQGGGTIGVDVKGSGPTAFGFYHSELNDKTDFQIGGAFSMEETEVTAGGRDVPELSDDDTTKAIIAGLRHQFSPDLELGVRASYDLDADDDEFSFEAIARYSLEGDLDVLASFAPDGDGDTITLGIKKYLNF